MLLAFLGVLSVAHGCPLDNIQEEYINHAVEALLHAAHITEADLEDNGELEATIDEVEVNFDEKEADGDEEEQEDDDEEMDKDEFQELQDEEESIADELEVIADITDELLKDDV